MAIRLSLAAVLLAALSAGAALAQDVAPNSATCLNSGNQYKVGEYACIAACHGARRLARCDAVAQTASWTYVSDACPSAMAPPSIMDATKKPIASAMTPIPLAIEHVMSEMSPEAWMRLTEVHKKLGVAAN